MGVIYQDSVSDFLVVFRGAFLGFSSVEAALGLALGLVSSTTSALGLVFFTVGFFLGEATTADFFFLRNRLTPYEPFQIFPLFDFISPFPMFYMLFTRLEFFLIISKYCFR